tara:strand:- start:1331 stop:2071 length:741 start_codon:yes stop_codon:yes gene_type:complete
MTIRYEINPPKVSNNNDAQIAKLEDRIEEISNFCDGIHVTESVLGIPRVSPFEIAKKIKERKPKLKVTVSLRTIDKTNQQIYSVLENLIDYKIDSVLVLMGDPPIDAKITSSIFPSKIVKELTQNGYKEKIEIFLSIPNNPNFQKITKKIISEPNGFVTQVIHNYEQVERIYNFLNPKKFGIIPCILFPSDNNLKSAEFLKLDWSNYKENFTQYVNQIHTLTNDVLITSPNDFKGALDFLSSLNLE